MNTLSCCGESPENFTRSGADHTGIDVGIRCYRCGREWLVESPDGNIDRDNLVQAWNIDIRRSTPSKDRNP